MLNPSRLVQVQVNLGPSPVPGRTFNSMLILGDSAVISPTERIRQYDNINDVADDFGLSAPEFKAAELYFEQSPQPKVLFIGRWVASATSGFNLGGIADSSTGDVAIWQNISNGGFSISINGAANEDLTGLDFSAISNLNGVASIITGALSGATCTWDGSAFKISSSTTGPGNQAVGAVGVDLGENPSAGDTLTIDGTGIEFVASSPIGNQVVIGADGLETKANLLVFLQSSLDANISKANYSDGGNELLYRIDVTYKTVGTIGNSFTLAKTGTHLTVSGAVLATGSQASSVGYAISPGAGDDISYTLKMRSGSTAASSQELEQGASSETPVEAVAAAVNHDSVWYALMFASTEEVTPQESLDISDFVEAQDIRRFYGVTTQNTGCLSSVVTNDLASLMQNAAYKHSCIQYSSTSAYAIASLLGRACAVDLTQQNSTIILMWKQEPGVEAEDISNSQANALEAKLCNAFVAYDNNTAIIEYGVTSSRLFIDEVWYTDWFQNAVQTALFNELYTAPTKIPQTTAGQTQLINAVSRICGALPGGAVFNGFAAPGVWTSSTEFGTLKTGQFLPDGYYIYAPSVDVQLQADRAARKAPPMQIALKLAGGFQTAEVIVTVNQ